MERLLVKPLPFGSFRIRCKRSTLNIARTLSGSAAFASLSSRMILIALRVAPLVLSCVNGASRDGQLSQPV